jgi:hypothetical protein
VIEASSYQTIETATVRREAFARNKKAPLAERKKAKAEALALQCARMALPLLDSMSVSEIRAWPADFEPTVRGALMACAKVVPISGSRAVEQALKGAAHVGNALWRTALSCAPELAALGVDMPGLIVDWREMPAAIEELKSCGFNVRKGKEGWHEERQVLLFSETEALRQAWEAAAEELGIGAQAALKFAAVGNGMHFPLHAFMWAFAAPGAVPGENLQELMMYDSRRQWGHRDGEDDVSDEEREEIESWAHELRESGAASGLDFEEAGETPEGRNHSRELATRIAGGGEGAKAQEAQRAVKAFEDALERAKTLSRLPERLFFRAVARGRGRESHDADLARDSAQESGELLALLVEAAPDAFTPAIASACAREACERPAPSIKALEICRRAGARLASEGKPGVWGAQAEEQLHELADAAREARKNGRETDALAAEQAIKLVVQWCQEDNLPAPNGSWRLRFAERALEALTLENETEESEEPARWRGPFAEEEAPKGWKPARADLAIAEAFAAVEKTAPEAACKALDAKAVAEQLRWSEAAGPALAQEPAAPAKKKKRMPDEAEGDKDVRQTWGTWRALSACVRSIMESQGLAVKAAPKKPRAL